MTQEIKFLFYGEVKTATKQVTKLEDDEYTEYFQILGEWNSQKKVVMKKLYSNLGFNYEFFEKNGRQIEGILLKGEDGKAYLRPHAGNMSYSYLQGDGYGKEELIKRMDIITDKYIQL